MQTTPRGWYHRDGLEYCGLCDYKMEKYYCSGCKNAQEESPDPKTTCRTCYEAPEPDRHFLVLDARSGKWSLHEKGKRTSALDFIYGLLTRYNDSECKGVEMVPTKRDVDEKGYELYGDETGMMKQLVMNVCFNPLCTENQIVRRASAGGPYGSLVLYNENGIDLEYLLKLTEGYDEKLVQEGEENPGYHEMLVKAIVEAIKEMSQ